jgi:hypothetical protein
MKLRFLALLFVMVAPAWSAPVATDYLRYLYGADDLDLSAIAHPHDDLWMLRGRKNAEALKEIGSASIHHGPNKILWERVQQDLCIVVVREGKVDSRFNLDQHYFLHRRTILRFLYAALERDDAALRQLVTDLDKVEFGKLKASAGDMGVYQELLILVPSVRVSSPEKDKLSQSVTYRLPVGPEGMELRLVRREGQWVIDTSQKLKVSLDQFFQ